MPEIPSEHPSATARRALGHPASLAAVVALLTNDFLLKHLVPGPITGKLSDFAGLVFFPLLLAVPLGRLLRTHRAVLLSSIAITGAWFSAVKTVPAAASGTEAMLASVIGDSRIVVDRTDLIALTSLVASFFLYRWAQSAPAADRFERTDRTRYARRKTASAVLVAVGAFATLATSYSEPEADAGFTDIAVLDSRVFIGVGSPGADVRGYPYISKDGGLSWVASRATDLPAPEASSVVRTEGPLCLRDQAQYCFRIDGSSSVYESIDSGVTWSVGWRPPPGRERFLERYGTSLDRYAIKSWDMAVVGSSGDTVLVAMGDDGLLRRTSDGTWTRDVVGTAKPIAEPWANITVELLAVVVLVALALAAASLLGRRLINVEGSFSVFVGIGLSVLLLTALIVGRVLGTETGSSAIQYIVILGPVGGWFGLAAVAALWAKTLRVNLSLGRRLLAHSSIAIAIGAIAATGAFYAWSAGWFAHWSVALVVASGAGIITLGLGARSMVAIAASSPPDVAPPAPSGAQEPDEAVDVDSNEPSRWQRREGLRRWAGAILLAVSSSFFVLGAATVVMLIPSYLTARWTGHRSPLARAMVAVGLLVVIPPILPFLSLEAAIDSLTGATRNPPTAITLSGAHVLLIGGAFAALLKAPSRGAVRARIVLLTAVYILAIATSTVGYYLLYLLPLAIVAIDGLASRRGESEPSTDEHLASTE